MYLIYPCKNRVHINTWAQINTRIQYSKAHKHICKNNVEYVYTKTGLGQKSFIGNKYSLT